MKYVDEYRSSEAAKRLAEAIDAATSRPWVLMEVCGGQTHAIVRHGLDRLLPAHVELVHGPGCPVCVTPLEMIDRAHAIAAEGDVILCSFGDMLRVPGSDGDLLARKAKGADVRIVYSPLDAVRIAAAEPRRRVVFFAVGFETTAPANAMAVRVAALRGLTNFSVLVSHVLVPPAMEAILTASDNRVQAFLGPGHVCTVMGTSEYEALVATHRVPIVVAGFEPVDLLSGILRVVRHLEAGDAVLENEYARAVRSDGNVIARRTVLETFEVCDRKWRGIGMIPASGFRLREAFAAHDAERVFDVSGITTRESEVCISGDILRGRKKPTDCPAFGVTCSPEMPLGATMVSSEGACAAYFAYRAPPSVPVGRRALPIAEAT